MNCATRFHPTILRTIVLSLLLVGTFVGAAHCQSAPGLKYGWKPGDEFHYDIEIESEIGDQHEKKTGTLVYEVKRKKLDGFQAEDSSGTAFVVGSDGYLATCAHVVGEAKEVEVTLGDRVLTASVVEVNPVLDVALLKVDASNLIPVPLADSSTVLQGRKISAFGFPLSDVLGEKLKITTGIVSGFVDNVGGCRNLQFDAKVNPGNSGGPVVDEAGNCLGIVTSKLTGIAVSAVGFAVPSSELAKLLQKHSKSSVAFAKSQAVTGTELVKMMSDSVALVKVKAEQHSTAFQIDWRGRLDTKSGRGKLIVDKNGEVSELTGDLDLPFLFGPLAQLAIEPLGGSSAPRWEQTSQTGFAISTADERRSPSSLLDRYRVPLPISPYSRPSFSPLPRPSLYGGPSFPGMPGYRGSRGSASRVTVYTAIQRTIFERKTKPDGGVQLKKTFQFQTTEKETVPFLSLTSTGNIEFDPLQHVPASAEFNGTLKINKSGQSISVPVKLTYRKVEKSVVEARSKEAAEKTRLAREKANKMATVPDPAKVKSLLADMKGAKSSSSWNMRQLDMLAPVTELRDEVFKAVKAISLTSSFRSYDFETALKVLEKYGYSQDDKIDLVVSAVEKNSKQLDSTTLRLMMKMPVSDRYRSRVVEIAGAAINGSGATSSVKASAKSLLARWAKGDSDASRKLLATAKRSLSGEMSSYERRKELEVLLKFDFADATRPEATESAKQALFTAGKDTSLRDVAAKLVLHCASPEDQLAVFCDYLSDVDNTLGDQQLEKAYDVLTESKSKVAQQVLIVRLKKQNYSKRESKALIKLGPACEDMLLKAYQKIPEVKEHLHTILEQVGTQKSVPVMERLELDCHDQYQRSKIHDSRVRMLKRLQFDKGNSATGENEGPSAANKLGELFGE